MLTTYRFIKKLDAIALEGRELQALDVRREIKIGVFQALKAVLDEAGADLPDSAHIRLHSEMRAVEMEASALKKRMDAALSESGRFESQLIEKTLESKLQEAGVKNHANILVQDILNRRAIPAQVVTDNGVVEYSKASLEAELGRMRRSQSYSAHFDEGTQQTGGGSIRSNPWTKTEWNLTQQGKILKENPDLARRLISEAGKSIADAGGTEQKRPPFQGNPWRKESFNLTEQGRLVRDNREEARRLAGMAGCVIA